MSTRSAICIAGSDSGGASGIQTDLKTLSALGVHGLSAITAITAQNTGSVQSVHVLPAAIVLAQLNALVTDFSIDAVKIGMLGSAANVRAVAQWLEISLYRNVVLDPILVSSSGRELLTGAGRSELKRKLLPHVDVLTPNLPEAEILLNRKIRDAKQMQQAAFDLMCLGPKSVLLKGGHVAESEGHNRVEDYFADDTGVIRFSHARQNFDARGTGCTLASALAANLALGFTPRVAARRAERYLQGCLQRAFKVGNANKRLLGHALKSIAI
jgi:hydroxymethylpyrimidine/phosphomethylpyrimidine kinase